VAGNEIGGGWRIVLQVAAVAAGFVAFLTLIGGALLRLRFDELGLPADRAVAELPESMLTGVGVHFLLGPAIAGLVAAAIVLTIRPETWPPPLRRVVFALLATAVVVAGLALLGAGLVWLLPAGLAVFVIAVWPAYSFLAGLDRRGRLLARGPTLAVVTVALLLAGVQSFNLDVYPHLTVLALLGLLAILVIEGTARRAKGRGPIALVVFAAFLVMGAAITYARTANAPTMEPVAVQLKDPNEVLAGFYVGESSDRIFVAELRNTDGAFVPAETVDTVVSVDRSRVVRTLLKKPAGISSDEEGRGQAHRLAATLRHATEPPQPATVTAAGPDERAKAFAPLLHLHPGDRSAPTSADYFLAHSRLRWRHSGCGAHAPTLVPPATRGGKDRRVGTIVPLALGTGRYTHAPGCDHAASLVGSNKLTRPNGGGPRAKRPRTVPLKEGFFLNLDNDFRRPKLEDRTRRDGPQAIFTNLGAPTPVYWEEHPAGSRRKRLTYWFFYPLSIPPGTGAVGDRFAHEGDWEGMSVLLARDPKSNDRWTPESVRYNAHHTPADVPWSNVEKATGPDGRATHPVGYVARDSHATYRAAGHYEQTLVAANRDVIRVDDVAFSCPDCPAWVTWLNLRSVTEEPWYGFGGAWGDVAGNGDGTGPLGPSEYRAGPTNPDAEESLKAGAEPVEEGAAATGP
jgi:hypothetical protein